MPDGPRKASLRAPTAMERIKSGLQDTLGIPESVWGMPQPDDTILAHRKLNEAKAAKGPVLRAPTMLERIKDTLQPVTSLIQAVGTPFDNAQTGPSQAITLARRAAGGAGRLTGEAELLERLIPRTATGDALDYRQFPRTIDAVADLVKKYPRVASHLHGIDAGDLPEGWAGQLQVPDRITKYIRNMGGETYRNAVGDPVARIRISPTIEQETGAFGPANTLAHEFTHAAQYIADPRRFDGTYDAAKQGMHSLIPSKVPNPGYELNPAEVAARAVGRRFASGPTRPSYADAIAEEVPEGVSMDALSGAWQRSREVFTKVAEMMGERLSPRTLGPR